VSQACVPGFRALGLARRNAKIAAQHIAWNVRDHRDRPAGDIDAVDGSGVEMVGQYRVASAVVGVIPDPARALEAAIAHFEQTPVEVIAIRNLAPFPPEF
jgi:hypothetical protein